MAEAIGAGAGDVAFVGTSGAVGADVAFVGTSAPESAWYVELDLAADTFSPPTIDHAPYLSASSRSSMTLFGTVAASR